MTWTYDQSLATDRDKVRFEIQDTDTSDQLFSNEEIDARLTALGSVSSTSLDLARRLMMRFARKADTTVGRVSTSFNQRFQAYKDIVSRLEAEGAALCMPSFGGTEVARNDELDADDSLVQPENKRDGDDRNTGDVNTFGGGG